MLTEAAVSLSCNPFISKHTVLAIANGGRWVMHETILFEIITSVGCALMDEAAFRLVLVHTWCHLTHDVT